MALYNSSELLKRSNQRFEKKGLGGYISLSKAEATNILSESTKSFSVFNSYDIFLTHSIEDARIILEIKDDIEKKGLSVYVDWIDDPELDRSKVTSATADRLKRRINSCKSLVYALSEDSKQSSWVQWELGYGDAKLNGYVAILPLEVDINLNRNFYKQEYLGLYPYIDQASYSFWVNNSQGSGYGDFKDWISGKKLW